MYSGRTTHKDEQRLDEQVEPIYNSSVSIQDVCSLEDVPGAMDDRDGMRERVWEIHASNMMIIYIYIYIYIHSIHTHNTHTHTHTHIYIYIYVCVCVCVCMCVLFVSPMKGNILKWIGPQVNLPLGNSFIHFLLLHVFLMSKVVFKKFIANLSVPKCFDRSECFNRVMFFYFSGLCQWISSWSLLSVTT